VARRARDRTVVVAVPEVQPHRPVIPEHPADLTEHADQRGHELIGGWLKTDLLVDAAGATLAARLAELNSPIRREPEPEPRTVYRGTSARSSAPRSLRADAFMHVIAPRIAALPLACAVIPEPEIWWAGHARMDALRSRPASTVRQSPSRMRQVISLSVPGTRRRPATIPGS
jgi:hypothetical protein